LTLLQRVRKVAFYHIQEQMTPKAMSAEDKDDRALSTPVFRDQRV
jgi:hypothetical protein